MAYQLITAPSNQEAVMTSLRDFATSNGWTLNNFTAANVGVTRGVMTLSRGDVFVSFRWEGTESESTKSITMFHALGYDGGNAQSPWLFPDDSGNGDQDDTLSTERRIARIGSGPFIALHLFASDTDEVSGNSAPHVYGVLEYAPGKYRHFSFGNLDKFGDGWTGGGFVCGHEWDPFQSSESNPIDSRHSVHLDGIASNASDSERATLHMEGLPGQQPSKFGVSGATTSVGTDEAGNDRSMIYGGFRRSLYTYGFLHFIPSQLTGFLPFAPVPIFYRRDTLNSNSQVYFLGNMPNIRMVQMRNFNPGDEITIGSVTWKIFPVVSKSNIGGNNEESENMGVAYALVS